MRKILFFILKVLSKLVLNKYKPKIVGISGSVGKTTTKGAIHQLLSKNFNVRASKDSFNNQIGLPLTILGLDTSQSYLIWLKNILKGIKLIVFKDLNYPEILILEMGTDRVGDIAYLNTIAPADIAVLTEATLVHVEWFGSLNVIYKEEKEVFRGKEKQICIINLDSEYIRKKYNELLNEDLKQKKVLTYGIHSNADVRALEIKFKGVEGLEFNLSYAEQKEFFKVKNIIAFHSLYPVLAATCVGLSLGMRLFEIRNLLEDVHLEKGRMNLFKGIKNSFVIDDSYNSSPLACRKALETLSSFVDSKRRIAVLGDMLELGEISQEEHKKIGRNIAKLGNIDLLITCGQHAEKILQGAVESGFKADRTNKFANSQEAIPYIVDEIREGDVILVKGSQGSRMEKIVKEIIFEKEKAEKLLVRQSNTWKK